MKENPNPSSQLRGPEPPNTIGLYEACELLVLPPQIVKVLCFSQIIEADMEATSPTLSLADTIAVFTVINDYRAYHREVVADMHEHRVWEALEGKQQKGKVSPKPKTKIN